MQAEIEPLLRAHWEEIAHDKTVPLDPDWLAYEQAEVAGRLRVVTARNALGSLVGYAVFFVGPHPHYKSTTYAVQDLLYTAPGARGTGLGAKLVIWCDNFLKADGVARVVHHVKMSHDFSSMLERLGYQPMDKILVKAL